MARAQESVAEGMKQPNGRAEVWAVKETRGTVRTEQQVLAGGRSNLCTSQESRSGPGEQAGTVPSSTAELLFSTCTWGELVLHPVIQLAGQPMERKNTGGTQKPSQKSSQRKAAQQPAHLQTLIPLQLGGLLLCSLPSCVRCLFLGAAVCIPP